MVAHAGLEVRREGGGVHPEVHSSSLLLISEVPIHAEVLPGVLCDPDNLPAQC